jgi:hypothetical protein
MALKEEIDPQYLCRSELENSVWVALTVIGILPKYLEPTEELQESQSAVCSRLLRSLSCGQIENLSKLTACGTLSGMNLSRPFNKLSDQYKQADDKLQRTETESLYVTSKVIYKSLLYIGLDLHGGRERLVSIMLNCDRPKMRFPTTSSLVLVPVKASKYFNVGVQVKMDLYHGVPRTLDEAIIAYTAIKDLVPDDTTGKKDGMIIESDIAEQLGSGKFSDLLWEFERGKFRLKTRKRFKNAMIDKAIEERVSALLRHVIVCANLLETVRHGDES